MFVIFFTPSVTLLLLRNCLLSSEKNAQLLLGKNREPEIKPSALTQDYIVMNIDFFKMDDEVEKERFFVIITRILLNWKCHKILMHN